MKKILLTFAIGGALVFWNGCAGTRQFVPLPDQSKNIENINMGRIYVLRPTAKIGSAVPVLITDDGKRIGNTGPKGYLCWERDPGSALIVGRSENASELKLAVEKGIVYYILLDIKWGLIAARNKLEILNEAEGKEKLKGCKPPKVTPKQ